MRCPACGARYDTPAVRCPECGALQESSHVQPTQQLQLEPVATVQESKQPKPRKNLASGANPSLIEFPGVTRTSIPEWRKELGERVREVQERRAREATVAAGEIGSLFNEIEPKASPSLELLPQVEVPPVNPLVVAALRRIERANLQPSSNVAVARAVAFDEQPEIAIDFPEPENAVETSPKPERVHNLAVVPMPEVPVVEIPPEITVTEITEPAPSKPRRLIGDQDDPALNYLDSIPTAIIVDRQQYRSAPLILRVLSGITDLAVVSLLSSPLLALTELTNLQWQNPRVIGFAVGTFLVISFLYLTVSIAFTGRTIGKKLFSLRVVDARTGLIPTGSQSAGRALLYVLSLASAGVALIYTIFDREKHSVHDRFTRTAVIRA
jgi:uncharacterized RDD family membrane protein YckC